ncbi:Histidine phosphatase [Gracilaria domingensis]|nr:Histidine phosphatase [Gracilaria domingensis]
MSLSLLLLALLSALCVGRARIIQVQIIHRHGARNPLKKSPTDPREETRTGSIYVAGVEQLTNLGTYVRNQYITSDDPITGIEPRYDEPSYVGSFSSNFERTQISARAFLRGLYPDDSHRIPTLVFNSSRFDWIIRGYAICPSLATRFEDFVKSSAFEERDKKDGAFVAKLAKNLGHPKEEQNLQHVFNVYDQYNIVNNGYDVSNRFNDIEELSATDMSRLRQVVDWYETTKFSFATHNIHVAGGLLATIQHHANTIDSTSSEKTYRIVEYSAHYPTLLTLWASIRSSTNSKPTSPADRLPDFGAALIVEVHQDESSRGDRILHLKWYRGGDDAPSVESIAFGIPGCTDVKRGCSLSQFERSTALEAMGQKKFCVECKSDLCDLGPRSSVSTVASSNNLAGICSVGKRITAGAIGACVGLTFGLLGAVLYFVLSGKRKRRDLESHARIATMEQSTYQGEVHA